MCTISALFQSKLATWFQNGQKCLKNKRVYQHLVPTAKHWMTHKCWSTPRGNKEKSYLGISQHLGEAPKHFLGYFSHFSSAVSSFFSLWQKKMFKCQKDDFNQKHHTKHLSAGQNAQQILNLIYFHFKIPTCFLDWEETISELIIYPLGSFFYRVKNFTSFHSIVLQLANDQG